MSVLDASLAHSSTFPEMRHGEPNEPIPEEDEDETSSEPAEAITPTSDSHPPNFAHHDEHIEAKDGILSSGTTPNKPLTVSTVNTSARPPSSNVQKPPSPSSKLPPVSPDFTSKPLKRTATTAIRKLFHRSNSHQADLPRGTYFGPVTMNGPAQNGLASTTRKKSFSQFTQSADQSRTQSTATTPPSPGSPTSTVNSISEQRWDGSSTTTQRPLRASTGLVLGEKNALKFAPKPQRPSDKKRSASVKNLNEMSDLKQGQFITRPAETGVGLKARRLSVSLPDDFIIDSVPLEEEFTSASKLPGKRGKLVGKGATATVKLMVRKGAGDEIYAVKEFRKKAQAEDADEYDKKVKSEYTISKSLHHPNIVDTVRLCTHAGRWNVVMEFCSHGELYTLVQQGYLQPDDKICLWKQLLRGVAYLHSNGIAHRDIKLENLLMNDEGHLKITDFGVSEVFCGEHPGARDAGGECGRNMKECRRSAPGICGSLPYIAPEVLAKQGDYDARPLDVWSCAIVLLTMIFGGQPWAEAVPSQPFYAKYIKAWEKFTLTHPDGKITDAEYPMGVGPLFQEIKKPALKILILKMLNPNPDKRIMIQDVVGDRWVKALECCAPDEDEYRGGKSEKGVIDASKGSCKLGKVVVRKCHNHLPPPQKSKILPQHRFDMGNGW